MQFCSSLFFDIFLNKSHKSKLYVLAFFIFQHHSNYFWFTNKAQEISVAFFSFVWTPTKHDSI